MTTATGLHYNRGHSRASPRRDEIRGDGGRSWAIKGSISSNATPVCFESRYRTNFVYNARLEDRRSDIKYCGRYREEGKRRDRETRGKYITRSKIVGYNRKIT